MDVPSTKPYVQTIADPKQLPLDPGVHPVMEDAPESWDFSADVCTVVAQMWEGAHAKLTNYFISINWSCKVLC